MPGPKRRVPTTPTPRKIATPQGEAPTPQLSSAEGETGQRAPVLPEKRKRISIIDVARMAGVSPSTVSRVLHNKPIVDPKVREMVLETVSRLNYRPNFAARNLPMGRTGYLALATPRGSQHLFTNPYVYPALEGIGQVIDESAFHLIISTTPKQMRNLLDSHAVDGMILIGLQMDDEFLVEIEQSDIAVVVIGEYKTDSRFTVLTPDYSGAIQIGLDHLAGLGHREIGFICGPPNTYKWRSNQIAFGEGITRLGLREVGSLVTTTYTEEAGYAAFQTLLGAQPLHSPVPSQLEGRIPLRLEERESVGIRAMLRERGIPTAYISTSDNLAIGIMRAAQDHSIAVPLELSVVSYGNISAAKMTQPPLTTTSGNFSKMCSDAATALIEMVDTHLSTPQRTVYPVELILRESTAKANPTAPS